MIDSGISSEVQLSDLIDTNKHEKVINEIDVTFSKEYPEFDFNSLESVFNDIVKLYNGEYPGYRECTTEYHNLTHTLDTFLTIARMIHGYTIGKERLSEKSMLLGLLSALMHDTGYIQTVDDNSGTGAKYTLQHISRSIIFTEKYFFEHDFSKKDFEFCKNCILCTNINTKMKEINFSSPEEEIMGEMLGISDLMSQMSDRIYLEKLVLLYIEFLEGKVQGFKNEFDLLNKTIDFFNFTLKRFKEEMGNMNKYLIFHFRERWDINNDLYLKAVEKNVKYLKFLMEKDQEDFKDYLRRDGILDQLYEEGSLLQIH